MPQLARPFKTQLKLRSEHKAANGVRRLEGRRALEHGIDVLGKPQKVPVVHFVTKKTKPPGGSGREWRRGRDSNPRYLIGTRALQARALGQATLPLRRHLRAIFSQMHFNYNRICKP